jgi:hypothetical protein
MDVTSLYTNIPHMDGKRAVAKQLSQHRGQFNMPSNQSLIKLLDLVLTKNNFIFNGQNYLQISGTAMGTKMAPDFEERHVYTHHTQPLFYGRFIDDIFGIWTGSRPDCGDGDREPRTWEIY